MADLDHRKLDRATDKVTDLMGSLGLSGEEGLLVLIRVAATVTAYDIYVSERSGTARFARTNEATDMVVELFRKFVSLAYDNLMLEGEPPRTSS